MKKNSLLDEDLTDVKVTSSCLIHKPKATCGVWFNMSEFHKYIETNYTFVDIMSFGASPDCCTIPVRRAVIGLANNRTHVRFFRSPRQLIMFNDIHAKIVIAYFNTAATSCDVFVGSHNFVGPSLYEIMVQVAAHQKPAIIAYYESFWTKHKGKIHYAESNS